MKEAKYLPIGSVVLLENGTKMVMVIGYGVKKEKLYDYTGCLYPEGLLSSDQVILFEHEDIKSVIFKGYSCEEQISLNQRLKDILSDFEQ